MAERPNLVALNAARLHAAHRLVVKRKVSFPGLLIIGRPAKIDTFQQHLTKFVEKDRGSVLIRKGKERAFKFRFRDPMMQPYVIMRGIEERLIPQSALSALSFPAEPELDFPSAQ